MACYKIEIKPSAVKELECLEKADRRRIVAKIRALSQDPRPQGVEKLSGSNKYRIRQGVFRVLYTIEDACLVLHCTKKRSTKPLSKFLGARYVGDPCAPLDEKDWPQELR